MFIRPWDAPVAAGEWRTWLGTTAPFGQLVVNNVDPDEAPIVVPTHAALEDAALVLHLATPNPVWSHLERARRVRFTIIGDYAFVPSTWRAAPGSPVENGVPTSYYATVQFTCTPVILDDPETKAEALRIQMRHFQPDGGHVPIAVGEDPYGPMLPGIRGLRLDIVEVATKFKFDDHKPVDHRARVSTRLDERGLLHDHGAAEQQRRRIAAIGIWRPERGSGR